MPRLRPCVSLFAVVILCTIFIIACRSPQLSEDITINITVDSQTYAVDVPAGSTVSQALQTAGISVSNLDKTEPPFYTVINEGDLIVITRVQEIFDTEQVVVPFERQIVRNETLPEGETRLVQAGVNGLEEVTTRRILENGVEVSKTTVKTIVITEAVPEIVMVGAQASFAPLNIPGTIAYLAGGSAWIMEGSTANRRVIVSSGDLDGRIFTL
ncbi:MAG: G5 domain-containing protein, partial [Anaerolineales bacterium]